LGGQDEEPNVKTDQGVAEVQHGTLDVAVASRRAIVVATDSRRSGNDGATTDDTKKLFLLPGNRVVAIAGLVDASLPDFPEITAQIPALLEQAIGHCGHLDMFFWENPLPSTDYPEELHHLWGADPYVWWSAIVGPIQTVFNIAATFTPVDLDRATVNAIVAGYRQNGEVKLDRLRLQPLESTPRGGRRFVGVARHHQRVTTADGFAATTIGASNLADALLIGAMPADFIPELSSYPGIEAFLERRVSGDLPEMPEDELVALAHDLVRATAARNRGVGSEPLQTAVIRFGQTVVYDQPITSAGTIVLPGDGTWHMGGVFTPDSDYPFAKQNRGAVFTDCEVSGNQSPIPLGDNMFFGSRFVNAVFRYDGGRITFGPNNSLTDCELRLAAGCPDAPCLPIRHLFSRVVQE
jgi:hypothetical protein